MHKLLSMLDRNLCVTEDSCLFFDSADAIARIIVRTRQNPFLPQPSHNAFNNKFIDTVRMHANLPDLKLPKGMLAYETDTANMGFGGRDGDPMARMVDELRTYTDQTLSEGHLLETIRRTSTAARTARSTDSNGADANRFRAAFETAKTILQTSIGRKHPFYLRMFPDDDLRDGSDRRAMRDSVPTKDLVEAALPYLDLSGNARYVPPFYQSLMANKLGRERFKVRPWGRHLWSAAVRQRWYESDRSYESNGAARELLTQLVDKHAHEQQGHSRGDVVDGDISLMDLAVLGGLNPRTFFDVSLWQFPNRYHGYAMEECNKNMMIQQIMYFFMCFLTDQVYDDLVEQKHDPDTALEALNRMWRESGDSRHREKRIFRNFWSIANGICKRIKPDKLTTLVDPEIPVNRAEQVHHFLYNQFRAIDSSEGFAPDITVPPPMHTRAPANDSMPTFGAGAAEDDSDDPDWDGAEECRGDKKYAKAHGNLKRAQQHLEGNKQGWEASKKDQKTYIDRFGDSSPVAVAALAKMDKDIARKYKDYQTAFARHLKAKTDFEVAIKLCAKTVLDEDDDVSESESEPEDPEHVENEAAMLRNAQRSTGSMVREKDAVNKGYGVKDSKSTDGGGREEKPPPGINALWIHTLRCILRGGRAYVAIVHRLTKTEREEARGDEDTNSRRFRELFARLVANVLVQSREAHPTSNRVFWERQMAETQFQRIEIMQQITMLCGVPTPVQIDDPWMKSHPVYF